jgi:hypothetical protein
MKQTAYLPLGCRYTPRSTRTRVPVSTPSPSFHRAAPRRRGGHAYCYRRSRSRTCRGRTAATNATTLPGQATPAADAAPHDERHAAARLRRSNGSDRRRGASASSGCGSQRPTRPDACRVLSGRIEGGSDALATGRRWKRGPARRELPVSVRESVHIPSGRPTLHRAAGRVPRERPEDRVGLSPNKQEPDERFIRSAVRRWLRRTS